MQIFALGGAAGVLSTCQRPQRNCRPHAGRKLCAGPAICWASAMHAMEQCAWHHVDGLQRRWSMCATSASLGQQPSICRPCMARSTLEFARARRRLVNSIFLASWLWQRKPLRNHQDHQVACRAQFNPIATPLTCHSTTGLFGGRKHFTLKISATLIMPKPKIRMHAGPFHVQVAYLHCDHPLGAIGPKHAHTCFGVVHSNCSQP